MTMLQQTITAAQVVSMPGRPGVIYQLDGAPYTTYVWDGGAMRPLSMLPSDEFSGVTNVAALRPWYDAYADAGNSRALIHVAGDSLAYGLWSDGAATFTDAGSAPNSLSTQLARLMNARLGTPTTFSLVGVDGRNSFAGGSPQLNVGLAGLCRSLSTNAETITFNLPACTAFDIIYYESDGSSINGNASPNTGNGDYQVDGGAIVPITDAASINQYKVVNVTSLANTTHTVIVRGGTGGVFYPCQILAHSGAGVVVTRNGRAGYTLSDVLGRTTNNNQSLAGRDRLLLAFAQGSPNLVILLTGHNECNLQSGTANGPQTVDGAAAVVKEVADLLAPLGIPLLLISEPDPFVNDSTFPFKFRDYWAGWRSLAKPGSNVAHLSIADYWGNFATSKASGYQSDASSVHPLRKGYGSIASLLAQALGRNPLYRTQLLTGA